MDSQEEADDDHPSAQDIKERQPNESMLATVRRIQSLAGDNCDGSDAFIAYKRTGSVAKAVALLRDPVNVKRRHASNLRTFAVMRAHFEEEYLSLQGELDEMINAKDCGENVPDRELDRVRGRLDLLREFLVTYSAYDLKLIDDK